MVTLTISSLLCYMEELSEEDGKRFAGRCASGAQIAGSLICPYLIVSPAFSPWILPDFQYKAVTTKVIDFVPLAPVAFTWIMELHAIIYSVGIDDFYMLVHPPSSNLTPQLFCFSWLTQPSFAWTALSWPCFSFIPPRGQRRHAKLT